MLPQRAEAEMRRRSENKRMSLQANSSAGHPNAKPY